VPAHEMGVAHGMGAASTAQTTLPR
jgi:hypothetical protein